MAPRIEIRPLNKDDDRSGFSCGEPALDRFFRDYAGQNQFKLGLSTTYLALLDAAIVGFATVSVGSIEKRDVPEKKLRKKLPRYPLPILRLARLGVARSAQGLGIGKLLLTHVLKLALQQRAAAGCLGVVTDAKPDAVEFYERLGFVPLQGTMEGRLRDQSLPMFLSVRAIEAALHEP